MEALVVGDDVDGLVADGVVDVSVPFWKASEAVGGEVGGLVLGLDSCEEEVLQSPAADSYLRLGLVEQRESDPASLVDNQTWTI